MLPHLKLFVQILDFRRSGEWLKGILRDTRYPLKEYYDMGCLKSMSMHFGFDRRRVAEIAGVCTGIDEITLLLPIKCVIYGVDRPRDPADRPFLLAHHVNLSDLAGLDIHRDLAKVHEMPLRELTDCHWISRAFAISRAQFYSRLELGDEEWIFELTHPWCVKEALDHGHASKTQALMSVIMMKL